nr:hypothetical protein CFP56_75595 [Quercus suber]
MAPNPIILPREDTRQIHHPADKNDKPPGLMLPLLATSILVLLVATADWPVRWLLSGCAIESLLVLYGYGYGVRVFSSIPLWTVLATLNVIYAICSTSWLLYAVFAAACYPIIIITCLAQFDRTADLARKGLRKMLRELHFTRDKIALFNLPALEIDTEVDGLMVIRGITISLSSLTIVAHGIELGLKLADDIELAMYCDVVRIPLFRRIEIGDVYGNVKGGREEMTFTDLDDRSENPEEEAIFIGDTPLLRAATAGSEGFNQEPKIRESLGSGRDSLSTVTRPKLRESMTGVSYMKDVTAQDGFEQVTALSPDDDKADKQYHAILTDIRTTSAIYQSRAHVRQHSKDEHGFHLNNENDLRAAICTQLHTLPSIPHPPQRSVRVTTLQTLSSPATRRFLHRLPFLLRLLLAGLSYFHLISIASINVAGSGHWVSSLLQSKVFKHYAAENAEIRRLERKLGTWLTNANFCAQLANVKALGQVPLSINFDIVAYLKFSDIMAYRTVPESGSIAQVVRIGGADATFTIPSYLLPHHEHALPARPSEEVKEQMQGAVEEAEGLPNTVQAENERDKVEKDESAVTLSVHASLPATFDQSLLNFVAALVKATKIIELEKEVDEVTENGEGDPLSPASSTTTTPDADTFSVKSTDSAKGHFKSFSRNIRQNLKDSTTATGQQIKETFKEMHQSTKDGMKRAFVGGMVNDRWIAKMVGKIAAKLEGAQGDVGYSGEIPVALAHYRNLEPNWAPKLLP